jgi:hypothetical protein
MIQTRRVAAALDVFSVRNSRPIGGDAQEAPVVKLPAAYVVALSVVVLFAIAAAASWAWFVSRELTGAYAEAFRAAGLPAD